MSKKITIIGRGTAGAISALHFSKWLGDEGYEIDWMYDPETPTQAVGEGSALPFPRLLHETIGFQHDELEQLDGSLKLGIYKENWTGIGENFRHNFPPPFTSYHFNALKLQDFIYGKLKDKVNIVEQKISGHEDIDSDWIMDCSGAPKDKPELLEEADGICVNSVHVTQCYWEGVRFQETLTIARPYGWVFGIPLKNRCSIGYLYNNQYTSLLEVKKDVKAIFRQYGLTPSEDTNTFTFNNYYRKRNFDWRVAYNGNASFFLEPMEATSISTMDVINRLFFDRIMGNIHEAHANQSYTDAMRRTQAVIAMHYINNESWDTPFWRYANQRSSDYIRSMSGDKIFKSFVAMEKQNSGQVGTWEDYSFAINMRGLRNHDKMMELLSG